MLNINSDNKNIDLKYILFIIISSIVGFVTVYLSLTKFIKLNSFLSVILSIVAVTIFVICSLLFAKILKVIYYSEIFKYIYIGFLTTAINIFLFDYFDYKFSLSMDKNSAWKLAEVIAFIVAVIFSFIANKIIVFKNDNFVISNLVKEFCSFIGFRLLTEIVKYALMYIMIDKNNINKMLAQIIGMIIVIVSNYFFSKLIIFKKKEE